MDQRFATTARFGWRSTISALCRLAWRSDARRSGAFTVFGTQADPNTLVPIPTASSQIPQVVPFDFSQRPSSGVHVRFSAGGRGRFRIDAEIFARGNYNLSSGSGPQITSSMHNFRPGLGAALFRGEARPRPGRRQIQIGGATAMRTAAQPVQQPLVPGAISS
jgi:hypothetical protein